MKEKEVWWVQEKWEEFRRRERRKNDKGAGDTKKNKVEKRI